MEHAGGFAGQGCFAGNGPGAALRCVFRAGQRATRTGRRFTPLWRHRLAGNCAEAGRSVTSKITSILLTFTEGSEHSLTEIARLAGLPISTAHRLTSELAGWRLLERTEDGLYRAGLPLRMIGTADDCPPTVAERGPCVLEDLSAATRSRARLGVLRELEVAYIEKLPGSRPATSFVPAATLPSHATALGRVLLAYSSPHVVELTILRGLRAYTPHTVTSPERLRRALGVTRLSRVAITRWELEAELCGIAMPVFGPGGDVVAAVELAVGDPGRDLQSAMAALVIATRSLSRELAGQPRAASVLPHQRSLTDPVAARDPVTARGPVPVAAGANAG